MFKPKRYYIELGSALALYVVLLFAANLLERALQPTATLLIAMNLLPVLGAIVAAWTIMRALRRMDELQRRVQFDAIALSFLGTALITIAWGFAEGAGLPHLRAFAIWPIMAALWGIGTILAQLRYR
ncbi:hypothetical protein RPMA_00825 [Tardiphaga alba]|uniref:Transmembrane protein n=1 Tax=Tardiphaga alba TaxID=340268 RepID=A0ABX8A380_9BRAD|nr:hypothetical protein [Tardiphaga alba]QUS37567.1 hypothetical protein RPMA_00825 [Tardiphaga alba]